MAQPPRLPQELSGLALRIRACELCALHLSRTHAVPGDGPSHARLFLIGEAPGRAEDLAGRPFQGAAGKILDDALREAGIRRSSAFITSSVKCRPPGNRRPRAEELAACRPYLVEQLRSVRPRVIVAMGQTAVRHLLGTGVVLARVRGRWHGLDGTPVIPTYHPAAVLYNRRLFPVLVGDLRTANRRLQGPKTARPLSSRPRPRAATRQVVSAGGVVFDAQNRVLLLRRSDERIWGFPKGHVEAGETAPEAALREIREESGLVCEIVAPLATVAYAYYSPHEDVNYDKQVIYFLVRRRGGELRLEDRFDEARWVNPARALRMLFYPNDRGVLRKARAVARVSRRT